MPLGARRDHLGRQAEKPLAFVSEGRSAHTRRVMAETTPNPALVRTGRERLASVAFRAARRTALR